jgi:hypothetical protein
MTKNNAILFVIIVFVLSASYWYYSYEVRPYSELKFNSEKWIKDEKVQRWYSVRIGMVSDLRKNYLKKGMPMDSVLLLLGDPMETGADSLEFKYPIGARMNMIDPDFLILFFDDHRNIIKTEVLQG